MGDAIICNKFVSIKHNVDGVPKEGDFEVITTSVSTSSIVPGSNLLLVKCLQVSIDPYQSNRMKSLSPSQNSVTMATKLVPGKELGGSQHIVGKPKKGERIFVSAASGSVGYLVGQYAKLLGCYVVGCAGTKDKVNLLKEKLGFDEAFNYREERDFNLALKRYFPEGIDVYFDNVGGEMLEAAVANMNFFVELLFVELYHSTPILQK